MVPSMYDLIWAAELVTEPSPKQSKPHLEATRPVHQYYILSQRSNGALRLTEDLVANLMLPDKISQELLIDTSLINDLPFTAY